MYKEGNAGPSGGTYFPYYVGVLPQFDEDIVVWCNVNIDGVWVDNRIYSDALNHNSWLHFTNHYHTQTSVLSHGRQCAAW
jgi:hypothetical protein